MKNKIIEVLNQIISYLDKQNITNQKVSNWSTYQHVEHILVSNLKIAELIIENKQNKNVKKLNLIGKLILLIGKIPRGKGKAPDFSKPNGLEITELKKIYINFIEQLDKLESLKLSNIIAEHPYFGGLSVKQWLKFIVIHQKHHLKIIKEICSKTN